MKKLFLILGLGLLLAGCGGTNEVTVPSESAQTISIENYSFVPKAVTIKVGETVTWVNEDKATHTVTGEGFDSGELAEGASFSQTFETAGTYNYGCTIHPSMTGTINVQ